MVEPQESRVETAGQSESTPDPTNTDGPAHPIFSQSPVEDSGSETLARYRFQAEVTARYCLAMLTQSDIANVVCEWHEDFVVAYTSGTVKLVSVKHREETQGPWTVPMLCTSGGLAHLFDRWCECKCRSNVSLKLETNAALKPGKHATKVKPAAPDAAELKQMCGPDPGLTDGRADMVKRVARGILKARWDHPYPHIPETPKVPKNDDIHLPEGFTDKVTQFLAVLEISDDPPQRRHITADNIHNLLEPAVKVLPDVDHREVDVKETYRAIVNRVERANRDEEDRLQLAAYIANPDPAGHSEQMEQRIARRTLTRDIILEQFEYMDSSASTRPRLSEHDALCEYHATLERRAGRLEFSLLADGIPPMTYPQLLDDIRVSIDSEGPNTETTTADLHRAARRLQRFVLCGLPGAGKTTAVEQLASSWAGDVKAPLPIVVNLRRLANKLDRSQHLTLSALLTEAVSLVESRHHTALIQALDHEVNAGHAILILDGLDECQSRAATLADDIADLLHTLNPGVGVMMTTRPSALTAAKKLELPILTLLPPKDTDGLQRALLNHIGDARISDESERTSWVHQRRAQLQVLQSQHKDLFKVPLLANLLTLYVASAGTGRMPSSRAELLELAVKESVDRWEHTRSTGLLADDSHNILDVPVLLDGFATIGHELSMLADRPARDVEAALALNLRENWGKARLEAVALAEKILEFWDVRLGVFVTQQDGTLTARSRVFIEIADSMWFSVQENQNVRRAWVVDTLSDESKSDTFRLAVSKTPELVALALDLAPEEAPRDRLLRWISDIAAEDPRTQLSSNVLEAILTEISNQIALQDPHSDDSSNAADDYGTLTERRQAVEGATWPFVVRIASLLLPDDLRGRRTETLTHFSNTPERVATAAGLAALADATYDQRPLDPTELDRVQTMLRLPLPADTARATQPSRGKFKSIKTGEPLLTGRDDGAERALSFINQLEPADTNAIAQISHKSSLQRALRIDAELTRLGHPVQPLAPLNWSLAHLQDSDGQWWSTRFFRALGDIEPPIEGIRADRWWCTDLFDLVQLLDVAGRPMDDFREALTDSHQQATVTLARIYASLSGIDLGKVADQIQTATTDGDDSLEEIAILPHPHAPQSPRLTDQSEFIDAAVRIVSSACRWHAALACDLIAGLTDEPSAAKLVSEIPDLPLTSRYSTAVAACLLTDDLAVTANKLITYDYQTRRAVAQMVRLADETATNHDILRVLRLDGDLTVRIAAGGDTQGPPLAELWTCRTCDAENFIDAEDCQSCTRGSKPHPEKSAGSL
ncbi:dsDNA nuclease domain-containing protein [Rhodococcus opacus]|uniref:dsDNA nuclease domain-containing protein n=1 Tax=Rhodococcus opacus TaxID=37919 RepID=UPI00155A79AB|nr:dsDNA nuclease domain-containing protein [Rhodococcus opacus]